MGVQSVSSSCEDHLINIGSCVDVLPIVVSVPIQITCLSGLDTIINFVLVGAFDTALATLDAVAIPPEVSQIKRPPSTSSANKSSPQLSSAQERKAIVTEAEVFGLSQVCPEFHVPVPHP